MLSKVGDEAVKNFYDNGKNNLLSIANNTKEVLRGMQENVKNFYDKGKNNLLSKVGNTKKILNDKNSDSSVNSLQMHSPTTDPHLFKVIEKLSSDEKVLDKMKSIIPIIKNTTKKILSKIAPVEKVKNSNLSQKLSKVGHGENTTNIGNTNPRLASDNKHIPINVSSDMNTHGLIDVANINFDQLKVLQDLRNICVQTLKVLAKNNDQSTFIPNITPTQNKSPNTNNSNGGSHHRLNVNRGDYGSSPYALA